MILDSKDVNELFLKKKINDVLMEKINSFFRTQKEVDLMNNLVDLIKGQLPCHRREVDFLKKAIETTYLSLLIHGQVDSVEDATDKRKIYILYGDLLIIEGLRRIGRVSSHQIRNFFYLKSKEISNAKLHFNVNFYIEEQQNKIYDEYANLSHLSNWFAFPVELFFFLELKNLNQKGVKRISKLIRHMNLFYLYHRDLFFLNENYSLNRLSFTHFYLKENHKSIFDKMKMGSEKIVPSNILVEMKKRLEFNISELSRKILDYELPPNPALKILYEIKKKILFSVKGLNFIYH